MRGAEVARHSLVAVAWLFARFHARLPVRTAVSPPTGRVPLHRLSGLPLKGALPRTPRRTARSPIPWPSCDPWKARGSLQVRTQAQANAALHIRGWVTPHWWQHVAGASRPLGATLSLRLPGAHVATTPLSRVPCHACLVNDLSLKSHRAFQLAFRSVKSKLASFPQKCIKGEGGGTNTVEQEEACRSWHRKERETSRMTVVVFLILDKSTHWLLFLAYCGSASLFSCRQHTLRTPGLLVVSCEVIQWTRGWLCRATARLDERLWQ